MNRALVLMYHSIAVPPGKGTLRSLYVNPRMFRFQMAYLKTAGFRVVPLKDILSFMNGMVPDKRLVAITFDDGYEDVYDHAYPVLKLYGYPSTVFLVSDLIGKENLWDCHERNVRKRIMGWDKILEMRDNGVVFGSHTKTHPFLSRLSMEEIEDEVFGSRKALEERLDHRVDFFCYPYGDYDERVTAILKKAGYLGAVTTKRGHVHVGDDPFEIRRSFIRFHTHPLLFMFKMHSAYEDRKGKRR